MAKKEIIYQGLADLNVLVEDTSISSPDYFRVTNIPSEFYSGRNILKFKGNPNLFNEGSPVYIEVLDYNGEPIYYEIGLDRESESQAAVITVFVNQDTTPGNGLITICGTASRDAAGNLLNTELINVRWSTPVYIDPSKGNDSEIIFESLPTATISASTGSYTNLGYSNGTRIISHSVSGLEYYYYNNTPVLTTSSLAGAGFSGSALAAIVSIPYTSISSVYPGPQGTVSASLIFTSSISSFSGEGIAYLADPLIFPLVNSNSDYAPTYAALTATITYEQSASLAATPTQNTFNVATVFFTGLQPQIGVVNKIRSYVKSSGVGEYVLSNETDISEQADELGFTADVVTASFALPTVHRNDRLDFKFEFVNPVGLVSAQYVELLNNLFLGGNTYIGGNDNLLTGSLFVAGATGTGVEITGKAQSAMVRSLGYQGFQNAITNNGGAFSGFVIYSGSVQSILGAAESYNGVGLELVANTSSYFKYASSGSGLLDIKTNTFFLGSNTGTFISGSDGKLQISASNFSVSVTGNVTASNMTLKNIAYADFFANKQIVVDNTNSGSYFKYFTDAGFNVMCALNLAGEQGAFQEGSAAMYIRFFVNPKVPISNIITPADTGYDGQIIIETYGPAYSFGSPGGGCGDGTFGNDVLLIANPSFATLGYNITATAVFSAVSYVDYGVSGSMFDLHGTVTPTTYFTDTSSITPPPGLAAVDTVGKKNSYRSRITFEVDDWASKSYTLFYYTPVSLPIGSGPQPPLFHSCLSSPYGDMLQCAPGGRYSFAPGDSGWRLQSVTNYSGSITPVFPNGIILYSPNKTAYRLDVDNAGALSTTTV